MVPPIGPISHSRSSLNSAVTVSTTTTAVKPIPKTLAQANFWDTYEYMCTLQSQAPLHFLKLFLSTDAGSTLVVDADKIKAAEWDPLCATLGINKNLKTIKVESKFAMANSSGDKDADFVIKLKKTPPSIRSRERTNKLCRSLRDCLVVTTSLSHLEIYNIPLSVKDCVQLGKVILIDNLKRIYT